MESAEKLSGLAHELASHVFTARLLLQTLVEKATPEQRTILGKLKDVLDLEANLKERLTELASSKTGAP